MRWRRTDHFVAMQRAAGRDYFVQLEPALLSEPAAASCHSQKLVGHRTTTEPPTIHFELKMQLYVSSISGTFQILILRTVNNELKCQEPY